MARNERSIGAKRLQQYGRLLRMKADEVRSSLSAERAAEVVSRPDEPLDFGDWCQKSHDEWLYLNQNRLGIALLREVEAALVRVKNGTYGICQRCSEPIAARRLDAVPGPGAASPARSSRTTTPTSWPASCPDRASPRPSGPAPPQSPRA